MASLSNTLMASLPDTGAALFATKPICTPRCLISTLAVEYAQLAAALPTTSPQHMAFDRETYHYLLKLEALPDYHLPPGTVPVA
jgi:hypothetical protein